MKTRPPRRRPARAASPGPAWPASRPPSIAGPPAPEPAPDTTAQPGFAPRASEPPTSSGGFLAPISVAPLGAEVRAGFEESRPSFSPFMPAPQEKEPYLYALQRRIAYLESQNHDLVARNTDLESRALDLEQELDLARRGSIDVEISTGDGSALADLVAARSSRGGDPGTLHRGVVESPRELDRLRALFRSLRRASDADRRWSTAQVLTALDPDGDAEVREAFDAHRPEGLIRPSRSLGEELWRSLLLHPDEDPLPGDIFSVVVPAVLLARASTQRRERNAPRLDPTRQVDPGGSTIQAVRCLGWAAAILGMEPPPLYAEPEWNGLLEAVVAVPLSTRLGRAALSGRSAPELAFLAGRHLSWFRRAHVIVKLCGSTRELEDVFLAALTIGNPDLPMRPEVRTRVQPVARAIEPLLDSAAIAALRGHVLVFIEQGGRTHLRRWAMAADRTAARAGLLLSNDLGAARDMLELEDPRRAPDLLDDLIGFATSERYAELRGALGVSVVA
ncbi:MAG: hypothetical protein WKG00_28065 [Polyangiaceae bacterium]